MVEEVEKEKQPEDKEEIKPFRQWSLEERREYNAKAVKKHREKKRKVFYDEKEKSKKLTLEINQLISKHHQLYLLKIGLDKNLEESILLSNAAVYLFENQLMRLELERMKLQISLFLPFKEFLFYTLQNDPLPVTIFISKVARKVKKCFNSKQDFTYVSNSMAVKLLLNINEYKHELIEKYKRKYNFSPKIKSLSIDSDIKRFCSISIISERIPFKKLLDVSWKEIIRIENQFLFKSKTRKPCVNLDLTKFGISQLPFSPDEELKPTNLCILKRDNGLIFEVYVLERNDSLGFLSIFLFSFDEEKKTLHLGDFFCLIKFQEYGIKPKKTEINFSIEGSTPLDDLNSALFLIKHIQENYAPKKTDV
eukprot:snap_masked-scaffold_37-processed-gene-1.20-mRNA-1 protein AED:0.12 eAED:1.00 QI:0/-1/0/1/-1/1/1/0/364